MSKVKQILDLVTKYFSHGLEKDNIIDEINMIITEINKDTESFNLIHIIDKLPSCLKLTEEHTNKSLWKNDLIITTVFLKIDVKSLAFKKAIHRVVGTILGIILFTIIFTIVKDPGMRMNITILVVYIGLFITKYQYSTSMVAISALGASAMKGGGIKILFFRILFTLVGCAIAMLVNKYILHYRIAHSMEDLIVEYNKEIKELSSLDKIEYNETRIYNLILNTKLMEYKINLHNKNEEN